jgi:hypothetical protein
MADVAGNLSLETAGDERKIRVLMDWTIELFFPRDIVQTINLEQEKP